MAAVAKRVDDQRPPLGFLLVRIAEAVDRLFVSALVDLGLKPRHLRLLVLVDRSPELSQRELAKQLGMDAGNLVEFLDTLEARGLRRRDRHVADRRQRLVALTADGEALLRRAIDATEQVEDRVFAHLSTGELTSYYETTLATYERIRDGEL
jgi:DNA-binding MarR family transcriptional regulator